MLRPLGQLMQADPHKLDFRNELLARMPGAGGMGPLGPMGGGLPPSHDLTRPASLFTTTGVLCFQVFVLGFARQNWESKMLEFEYFVQEYLCNFLIYFILTFSIKAMAQLKSIHTFKSLYL